MKMKTFIETIPVPCYENEGSKLVCLDEISLVYETSHKDDVIEGGVFFITTIELKHREFLWRFDSFESLENFLKRLEKIKGTFVQVVSKDGEVKTYGEVPVLQYPTINPFFSPQFWGIPPITCLSKEDAEKYRDIDPKMSINARE
jgi:hypothetical protein